MTESPELPPAPNVPVFNCVVLVSPRADDGLITARAAELVGLTARAKTEREALTQLVAAFKAVVARHHAANEPIPWLQPPLSPAPGDSQRLIAVHL